MTQEAARDYLRTSLADPDANFRDGQWESIDTFVPLLLEMLASPATTKAIAEVLDVSPAHAAKWPDRAVEEKRIVKSGQRATFRRADAAAPQASMFRVEES